MNLPDKDHPIWKLLNSMVSLVGLILFAYHLRSHSGIDLTDGMGLTSLITGGTSYFNYTRRM